MEKFFGQLLAPFVLLVMLCIAYPIKRAVEKKMKPGRLKRILLFTWGNHPRNR